MKLTPLTVGPIVGETTPKRVRIWGRGDTEILGGIPRRCFGALRHRKVGSSSWEKTRLFKMNPNFDMTGIAIVDRLKSETSYEYEVGYFFSEAELDDARFRESHSDWADASRGRFLTASANDKRARTLVIGSCRYLLRTFLGSIFDSRGDKTFRSINRQIADGRQIHQLIMMGDQIYADDLNVFNPDKTVSQFYKRYRDAFSQRHLCSLMSQVPTYMTLDDHEIENNWPSSASDKDWKTLFPIAIHAFQSYQLAHSPCIPIRHGQLDGTPKKLWYDYTDGCCDVFVTDSRTERFLSPTSPEMINEQQMRALKAWLADGSGRVKIVVTSVPFFPDPTSGEGDDKWAGFVSQRKSLLTHIERRKIRRVAFFSGDVHASMSVELTSPTGLKLISVISSPFFWPYPHPSARHFQTKGTIDGGDGGIFRLSNASRVINDDNFTVVDVSPQKLEVTVYERKGKGHRTRVHTF